MDLDSFALGVSTGAIGVIVCLALLAVSQANRGGGVRGHSAGTGKRIPPKGGSGTAPPLAVARRLEERDARRS